MSAPELQIFPADDQIREAKNVDDKDLKPSLRPGAADGGKEGDKDDRPERREGGGHETDDEDFDRELRHGSSRS